MIGRKTIHQYVYIFKILNHIQNSVDIHKSHETTFCHLQNESNKGEAMTLVLCLTNQKQKHFTLNAWRKTTGQIFKLLYNIELYTTSQ